MRHFIRHPADIPIEVSAGNQLVHATRHIHNVSLGGLAFESDGELERRSVRGEAVGGDVEPLGRGRTGRVIAQIVHGLGPAWLA